MDQSVNRTPSRIAAVISGMTLDEKLAQLVGVWVEAGADPGAEVAPLQDAMEGDRLPFEEFACNGIGQIELVGARHAVKAADSRWVDVVVKAIRAQSTNAGSTR